MGCGFKAGEAIVYFTKNQELVGGFVLPTVSPMHPVVTGADLAKVNFINLPNL